MRENRLYCTYLKTFNVVASPCFLSSLFNVSALLNRLSPETYRLVDLVKVESEDLENYQIIYSEPQRGLNETQVFGFLST